MWHFWKLRQFLQEILKDSTSKVLRFFSSKSTEKSWWKFVRDFSAVTFWNYSDSFSLTIFLEILWQFLKILFQLFHQEIVSGTSPTILSRYSFDKFFENSWRNSSGNFTKAFSGNNFYNSLTFFLRFLKYSFLLKNFFCNFFRYSSSNSLRNITGIYRAICSITLPRIPQIFL